MRKKKFPSIFPKKMMSHFSKRQKSLPNPGVTFNLYTFNKSIGKSVIQVKGKKPETLYLLNNIIKWSESDQFFIFSEIAKIV
jgi:hypothetical protein